MSIILYGIGAIGSLITRLLLRRGIKISGAIDIDENKIGKDLGTFLGIKKLGIKIKKPSEIKKLKGNLVILTTGSRLKDIKNQVMNIAKAKKSIISSCEELSFPLNERIKNKINKVARKNNIVVLATGVNPGFVLDSLILCLSNACQEIKSISAERIVDVSKRRIQLQKKIGVGLEKKEFYKLLKSRRIGHIGLKESVAMLASGLGFKLSIIDEKIKPVLKGKKVIGIRQTAYGAQKNKKLIRLDLQMFVGAKQRDNIKIGGIPPINVEIKNGIQGDLATAAIIANLIPKVLNSSPGLKTMTEFI